MRKIVILIMISGMFLVSCESRTYEDISPIATNPTYEKNVRPVIVAQCLSCHADGSQYPVLNTYTEVKDATQNGDLLCRIDGTCGEIMPTSGKMPQVTVNMIYLWNDQGCIEK